MNTIPLRVSPIDRDIAIHPIEPPEKRGMIHVPDSVSAKTKINQGIIVEFGPKCVRDGLEIGDHVVFNGYTGDQVTLEDGGQFFIIPEKLIVCKLNETGIRLFDSETVKKIIEERIGEMKLNYYFGDLDSDKILDTLSSDLIDRINFFTTSDQFEF